MTRFMILTKYGSTVDVPPMSEWDPADMQAHLACLQQLNADLAASGELVEMEALAGPDLAKIVTADGVSRPVVTDGPFPEAKELLAGYQLVDVESVERALEIAAAVSAAPGPGGEPLRQQIEVRQVMFTRSLDA